MSTAREWVEMLLQNSKAVGSLLIILLSGLGFSTWTVFDQQQEIVNLKQLEIKVVKVPVDAELKKLRQRVKKLEIDVGKLNSWH